jgi:serine/threonine protein kinase
VLGELGRGGVGVVYKARQTRPDRLVALKVMRTGRGAPFLELARFRVDAEAVAGLDHPNIARIHDVGVCAGFPYLALEFAPGGSLAPRVRGRPQPPGVAAELVRTLALALQHAHGRRLVHRDLKPANVVFLEDGTPKLTDFALAKFSRSPRHVGGAPPTASATPLELELNALRQQYSEASKGQPPEAVGSFEEFATRNLCEERLSGADPESIPRVLRTVEEFVREAQRQSGPALLGDTQDPEEQTEGGAVLGSPEYVAPERALGQTWEVGPATDVYGLGAILYEALTGRPPFRGATLWEVLEQVTTQPPQPFERAVPAALEAVCRRCLEKAVDARYGTAAELAEDLGRFLGSGSGGRAGAPAVPSPPPPGQPGDPKAGRRWWHFWK